MIPKVIHLTYKSKNPKDFPERCAPCYESIQKYFVPAGYRVDIADDADMDAAVKAFDSKLFELYRTQPVIVRTDIWRIVVLYTRGGYYMDTDVLWEKCPVSFFESCKADTILCQDNLDCFLDPALYAAEPISVGNFFMASRAQAPFMKLLIDRLYVTLDPANELVISTESKDKDHVKVHLLGSKPKQVLNCRKVPRVQISNQCALHYVMTMMKAGPDCVCDVFNRSTKDVYLIPAKTNHRVGDFATHKHAGMWTLQTHANNFLTFELSTSAPAVANTSPQAVANLSSQAPTRYNLGCGDKIKEGFVNIDKYDTFSPDKVMDLEQLPWDLPSASAEYVLMNHVLEHIGASSDIFLGIMQELYRICKPGAVVEINVPHPLHKNFRTDPTHVRRISASTLEMFSKKHAEQHQRAGSATTPLATILNVDFEIIQNNLIPDMDTVQRLRDKGLLHPTDNNDILRHSEIYCNLINEVRLKVRRV